MKRNLVILLICSFFIAALLLGTPLFANKDNPEKILSYHTDIEIAKDFSMLITETIKVRSANIDINRGIIRDLPKQLIDKSGNARTIDPEVVVVFKGDAPDGHFTKDLGKGMRVFIGKKDLILPKGEYTYTIIYKVTNPTILKEGSYDLFWDVTGVRWLFPIEKASARVKVPSGSSARIISKEGYLGGNIVGEDDIFISRNDPGDIIYDVKRPLEQGERFELTLVWKEKPQPKIKPRKDLKKLLSLTPGKLNLGRSAKVQEIIKIPINEPIDFGFKERETIFEIRKEYVNQQKDLLDIPYLPYAPAWRLIGNKKPWWSIKGAFCYGPGEGSITGETSATRYLNNPFLLLGIDDAFPMPMKKRSFIPIYPRLLSLEFDAVYSQAIATYDISRYFKERAEMPFDIRNTFFTLININARDFGYKYIYAPKNKCVGITPSDDAEMFEKPTKLIHTLIEGKSCEYRDGCNEIAPVQPELDFQVSFDSQSILFCKLWKNKPKDEKQKADFSFIIKFQ